MTNTLENYMSVIDYAHMVGKKHQAIYAKLASKEGLQYVKIGEMTLILKRQQYTYFNAFKNMYFDWYKDKFGFFPKFTPPQGMNMKRIIDRLLDIEQTITPVEALAHILTNYNYFEHLFKKTGFNVNMFLFHLDAIIQILKHKTSNESVSSVFRD